MRPPSFKTRLIAGTLGLVLGFVAVAVGAHSALIEAHAERQIARDLAKDGDAFAIWRDLKVAGLRERAGFLGRLPLLAAAVGTHDPETASDVLRDLAAGGALPIAVVDADGAVVASTLRDLPVGRNVRCAPGVDAALRGEVTDSLWPGKVPLLAAVAPLLAGEAVTGALVAIEPLDARAATAIAAFTGRDVIVLGEDGAPAACAGCGQRGARGEHLIAALSAAAARTPPPGGRRLDVAVDGRRHIALHLPIHGRAGSIVLSRDLHEIDALSSAARYWLFAAGATIAALGILFSVRTAARLTQPLRELTQATSAMTDGDLAVRVEVRRDDEIGALGASFNAMAARIGSLIENVSAHARRAEAANRAKDRFLSSMSHELRTPITAIKASAEILLLFGDDSPPNERAEFALIIGNEADRLAYIVGQVLDFTRLAGGHADLQLAAVDVSEVVRQAAAGAVSLAAPRRIEFELRLDAGAIVHGDARRLGQLASALLRNAVQFAPVGSLVTVVVRTIGEQIEFTVCDRGPGIPDAVKELVFESFYQHGDPLTGKPDGPGLGLSIARAIATAHNGRVWCEDHEGGGARFVVALPAFTGAAEAVSPDALPSALAPEAAQSALV